MNTYRNVQRPQQGGFKRKTAYKRPNRPQQNTYKPQPEIFTNFCQSKCASIDDNTKKTLYTQITQQYQFEHKPVLKLGNQMPHKEYLVTIIRKINIILCYF